MGKYVSVSIFLMFLLPLNALPEGTKQIAPFQSAAGELCIDKSRNDFGFFNASPEFKINICITANTEKIKFGLGRISWPVPAVNVQYRLTDPAGNVVIGPTSVPQSGQGFIPTYSQASIGPFVSAGGYNPVQFSPSVAGNYNIEFFYPPDNFTQYTEDGRIQFEFFDITVVDQANEPIPGRVWSKAWQFNCGFVEEPPTMNRFYGKMFILSDDSIVTSVNCNGFVGGTFSISSNKTGCSTTGNLINDRQSRNGFHTYPQYKVFLSAPDSLVFPTGTAKPAISLPVNITNNCATGGVGFEIKVTQDGLIEVLVELDTLPGTGQRDIKLTANVLANPGGNGYNTINWNGNDGLGQPVVNGTAATATIRFIHGITHLPIYDIEYNDNGYIVEVVRPPGPKPGIYWDDSLLTGIGTLELNGCADPAGCHTWSIEIGDTNTINSWWYVASSTSPEFSFIVKRSPGKPGAINGETLFCEGGIIKSYTFKADPNSTSYTWFYSGTDATITGNNTSAAVTYGLSATSGTLSVTGFNAECGNGPPSSLPVSFFPPPQVELSGFDSVCFNEPVFLLTGGSPPGGEYYIDGIPQTGFDPAGMGHGSHIMVYRYSDIHGCKNSDSALVFVKTGQECEIVLWVPNAFTPDGDGLNHKFHPVSKNIREFNMCIYSRNGEMVFTTTDPDAGWDGTYRGRLSPEGNYVYVIVYKSSMVPPEDKTISGNIILVR